MKIYFIADTHFNHKNILEYCNRPFADVEEMNKILVNNWNDTVKHDDVVYMLGDFCMGNKQEIKNATLYKSIRTFTNLTGVYVGSKILILTEVQDAFIDKIYRIVIIWTVANLISDALELNEIVIERLNKEHQWAIEVYERKF